MTKRSLAAAVLVLSASVPALAATFPYVVASRAVGATSATGAAANGYAYQPALSPDGNGVAFWSEAINLVPGIATGVRHIYYKNLATGAITVASRASNGTPANGYSLTPQVSPVGGKVLFSSLANNLVAGDRNNAIDVFEHDLKTGKTRRVSLTAGKGEPNNGSFRAVYAPDGKSIAFASYASNIVTGDKNGVMDVFVRNLVTGAVRRVSIAGKVEGDQDSFNPTFSADGRYLAFVSGATTFASGIPAGMLQVYRVKLPSGRPELVSKTPDGKPGNGYSLEPSLSPTGDRVVFETTATNLLPKDTNKVSDIAMKSVGDGSVRRISTNASGGQANGASTRPRFTFDGADVVFTSLASNIVSGDRNGQLDVFIKNLATDKTIALSRTPARAFGTGYSFDNAVAPKARAVAFTTTSTGLVKNDANSLPHPIRMTLAPK